MQRNSNVKNIPTKEEAEKFCKKLFGKNNKDITVLLPTQLFTVNKSVKTAALLIQLIKTNINKSSVDGKTRTSLLSNMTQWDA